MNEMLGNHYFLTKRYKEAIPQYKMSLEKFPNNLFIKKKLIICLLNEGETEAAIKEFTEILDNEDIGKLLEVRKEEDECSCKQMIFELENNPSKISDIDRCKILGILWLFCNSFSSLKYFEKLQVEFPKNSIYEEILNNIKRIVTHN